MLNSITLDKYKSFQNRTTIDLKPLTILCGVNSSGKSSALKSLLMMRQTVDKETPYNKLAFMGDYVDNGYFDDIVNSHSASDYFVLQNTFTLKRLTGKQRKRNDMLLFKELSKLYYRIPGNETIGKFTISHFVKVTKSGKSGLLGFIDNNNVAETIIDIKAFDKEGNALLGFDGHIHLEHIQARDYTLQYDNLPFEDAMYSMPSDYNNKFTCYFSNIKLTNFYKANGIRQDILAIKPTLLAIFDIASRLYASVHFIAPLRYSPSRFYTVQGDVSSVGVNGESAPILLAKLKNQKAYEEIATPDCQENDNLFVPTRGTSGVTFYEQAQRWFTYLGLGELSVAGDNGQFSVSFSGHNIADIGFGVSQVMPIVVQGLSLQKDDMFLLEQPEIHLHPKMQMRMADFLLSLATSERNLIVETHSDHIINRVVRRCLEDTSLIDKVKILFFSRDELGATTIEEIPIDPYLGIDAAPTDFFDQYASETDMIISKGYRNMVKDNSNNA